MLQIGMRITAILLLVVCGLGCDHSAELRSEYGLQAGTYATKRLKAWHAGLRSGAVIYRINPRRGALEPASTVDTYYGTVTVLEDFARSDLEPGWVGISVPRSLGEDVYFVHTADLVDPAITDLVAYQYTARHCPVHVMRSDGRLVPTGALLPSEGFGFPVDSIRLTSNEAYARVLLSDGWHTGYVSSRCLYFGPKEVHDTADRVRERVLSAPIKSWEVPGPMAIHPDFEASLQQFVRPLLLVAMQPVYRSMVQRGSADEILMELENALVAIFSAEIEAADVEMVVPGIWGYPTASITPLQFALLLAALANHNPAFLASSGHMQLTMGFMDPRHGAASTFCAVDSPPSDVERQTAALLLAAHIDGDINWLESAETVRERRLLSTELVGNYDILEGLVSAFGLLTAREAAVSYNSATQALWFVPGEPRSVAAKDVILHNHPSGPQLIDFDLRNVLEAKTLPFFADMSTSGASIIHPTRQLAMRTASALLMLSFDGEPIFGFQAQGDISAAAVQGDFINRIVVRCPGGDGKSYQAWEHYNDLQSPSEWRTPFGRVIFRPTIPPLPE
ncbi:MAG: hypothetical protein H6715_03055 [Myxococcales bacterium]|nr:hypothetical protein [Myxococcales bacterium]